MPTARIDPLSGLVNEGEITRSGIPRVAALHANSLTPPALHGDQRRRGGGIIVTLRLNDPDVPTTMLKTSASDMSQPIDTLRGYGIGTQTLGELASAT